MWQRGIAQTKILYKNTVMQANPITAYRHAEMPAGVWRASERPTASTQAVSTGHAALDERRALRGDAVVVPAEGAHPALERRVGGYRHVR